MNGIWHGISEKRQASQVTGEDKVNIKLVLTMQCEYALLLVTHCWVAVSSALHDEGHHPASILSKRLCRK